MFEKLKKWMKESSPFSAAPDNDVPFKSKQKTLSINAHTLWEIWKGEKQFPKLNLPPDTKMVNCSCTNYPYLRFHFVLESEEFEDFIRGGPYKYPRLPSIPGFPFKPHWEQDEKTGKWKELCGLEEKFHD